MRKLFPLLVLLVLLFTACSITEPTTRLPEPDVQLASITIGADLNQKQFAPLGIPFVDGNAVVTALEVEIFAGDELLTFDAQGDSYTYNPKGINKILRFPSDESVTVILPAGTDYTFKTRGNDKDETWIAYGETSKVINFNTTSVNLVLQTLLDEVSISTSAPLNFVMPGQTLDFYLKVLSPGGYSVPIDDFTVTYTTGEADGQIIAFSSAGARVTVTDAPADNDFTLTAAVEGWINDNGTPHLATATYWMPFSVNDGVTLNTDAPEISFDDPGILLAGTPAILSGTASHRVGLNRVQVYEGPVLIGSSDPSEHGAAGVVPISFSGDNWTMQWTAPTTGTYAIRAVAIDSSGNQSEYTRNVVSRPINVNFFNNTGLYLVEPVSVGAILRLTGNDEGINHDDFTITISRDGEESVLIAHGNPDIAASEGVAPVVFEVVHHMWEDEIMFSEAIWSVLWGPDASGNYSALASDDASYHDAVVAITVQ